MAEEKFEEDKFMKILVNLKDTQESIQGFSGWCIRNRKAAYKMARCWIKVIKKVRVEQKLVLFYLVNDIVQHSAKRGYNELIEKFRNAIKEAMPHLKDEKIGPKVQRCLDIWEERDVFDKEYIQDLTCLIDLTPVKEDQEIVENFQPPQLCTQIKILKALEDDADYKLKTLKENELDIQNIEEMKLKLKDKNCGAEFVQEFEDGTKRMEQYIKAMEREIRKRRQVIELLGQGKKYYDSVFGEAEIVATAYHNFGNRVNKVKVKLGEKIPELGNKAPSESPVPSPDYDAPSPAASGDEMEIKLPDEGNGFKDVPKSGSGTDLNSRLSGMTGMSYESFQTPSKDGYSISEFLTKMAQGEEVDVDSFISGGDRKRRKLSGGGYDPASGGLFDTPQPRAKDPWAEQSPAVPDLLSWQDESQEVENRALARLKQAAANSKRESQDNGVQSSNLVSLTGSPAVKDRKKSGGSRSDMDVSDDDNSSGLRDSFLDESFPPPGPAPAPWEAGVPPHHPPPGQERFSAPPPALMLQPPMSHQPPVPGPGFNGNHHDHKGQAFHNVSRPPPFLPDPDPSTNANLQPLGGGGDSGRGRGGFRGNRGGFGHRGRGGAEDGLSQRFPGAPGHRFPGPPRGFSDNDDSDRGAMRGGRGGFRGHHKDLDGGRGGFDRGRGGPRGGWNGARRPWGGNMRGRGGHGPRGGPNW